MRISTIGLHLDSNKGAAIYPGRRSASLNNVVAPLPARDAGFRGKSRAKTRIYYFSGENTQFLTEIFGMAKCSHISSCENLDKLIPNKYSTNTALECFSLYVKLHTQLAQQIH